MLLKKHSNNADIPSRTIRGEKPTPLPKDTWSHKKAIKIEKILHNDARIIFFFFNQNSNIHSCGAKGPQVKKNLPVYLLLHSEFFRSTFFLHHLRNFWVHEIQITIMISVCIFLEKIMLKILKLEKIQIVYEIFRWFPPREKKRSPQQFSKIIECSILNFPIMFLI